LHVTAEGPAKSLLNDADHWRKSAADMRAFAGLAKNPESRESFLKIAEEYDKLAARAVKRASGSN
jgi:hypothetical protein